MAKKKEKQVNSQHTGPNAIMAIFWDFTHSNKLSANNLNDCVNRPKHGPNNLNIVESIKL